MRLLCVVDCGELGASSAQMVHPVPVEVGWSLVTAVDARSHLLRALDATARSAAVQSRAQLARSVTELEITSVTGDCIRSPPERSYRGWIESELQVLVASAKRGVTIPEVVSPYPSGESSGLCSCADSTRTRTIPRESRDVARRDRSHPIEAP